MIDCFQKGMRDKIVMSEHLDNRCHAVIEEEGLSRNYVRTEECQPLSMNDSHEESNNSHLQYLKDLEEQVAILKRDLRTSTIYASQLTKEFTLQSFRNTAWSDPELFRVIHQEKLEDPHPTSPQDDFESTPHAVPYPKHAALSDDGSTQEKTHCQEKKLEC